MSTDVYPPLEGFLLLRHLPSTDLSALRFDAVSEVLKQNAILKKSDSFDASRLEPEYLKSQYLRLLNEEAKAQDTSRRDRQASLSPSKRKLASPRLKTVEEASHYAHLLPKLVERLYFHYQNSVSQAILEDENNYHQLVAKTRRIELGENHGEEAAGAAAPRPTPQAVPSIQNLLTNDGRKESAPENELDRRQLKNSASNGPYRSGFEAVVNGKPALVPTNDPTEAQSVQSEQKASQNSIYRSGSQTASAENGAQYPSATNPPPPPPPPYTVPSNDIHGRLPPQATSVLSPSPRPGQPSLSPPERASTSPIILPPVPGMLRSQVSSGTNDTASDTNAQLYRPASNVPTPQNQVPPSRPHSGRLPPPPRAYGQPYQYHENQTYSTYGHYNQQYHPHAYPPNAPYQYSPMPSYQTPIPPHPQYQNYYASYSGQSLHTPYRGQQTPDQDQHTPYAGASDKRRPAGLTPITTSSSSTKWKNIDLQGSKAPGSPVRPQSREISPISSRSESPEQADTVLPKRETRNRRKEEDAKSSKTSLGRGDQAIRRGRSGQTTSMGTPNRGRTRSHSITSHTDDQTTEPRTSMNRKIKPEPLASFANEDEVSTTSHTADESTRRSDRRRRDTVPDNDRPTTPRTSVKRKRGDSNTALLPSPSLRSTSAIAGPQRTVLPKKPGYVLVFRNLTRTTNTLLNSITQHKYASLFAKPLTEREAPGYNSLIHRVQDLKSIKSAISAGTKAVSATIEQSGIEIAAGTNHLWIPESDDVLPPKAIVNSSQLEKELIRIFANAVMFNPDLAENRGMGPAFRTRARTLKDHLSSDDKDSMGNEANEEIEGIKHEIGVARPEAGAVVKDARDMYGAVEEALDGWKGIGGISEEEAQAAPVIEVAATSSTGKAARATEQSDEGAGEDAEDETQEESERPRPKRRRR